MATSKSFRVCSSKIRGRLPDLGFFTPGDILVPILNSQWGEYEACTLNAHHLRKDATMEQTSTSVNKKQKSDFKNSPLVEVTRTFHAPVDRVWKAWSYEDLTKQWWGPEDYTCPKADID